MSFEVCCFLGSLCKRLLKVVLGCAAAGVAFHHGGLDLADRHAVEKGFRDGQISVICCTSTLSVGVNLPCHFVIIKNTMNWQTGGLREYADLEIMQMLGRAGRYRKRSIPSIFARLTFGRYN